MIFTSILFYISGLIFLTETPKSNIDSEPILIGNSYVTCYSDRLVIHLYYFPYGDKTIKYSDIKSCKLLRHDDFNLFETKQWGMAFSPIWWPADFRRPWREYYIILDVNQWPKIGITMDDNDTIKVYHLIKQKMNE